MIPRDLILPEPCLTCGGVHGSYSTLATCTCMECPRCEELDEFCLDALCLWLGVDQ